MTSRNMNQARWRKSSFSGTNTNCVEVATASTHVGVRDSKHPETPPLTFPARAWHTFVTGTR